MLLWQVTKKGKSQKIKPLKLGAGGHPKVSKPHLSPSNALPGDGMETGSTVSRIVLLSYLLLLLGMVFLDSQGGEGGGPIILWKGVNKQKKI